MPNSGRQGNRVSSSFLIEQRSQRGMRAALLGKELAYSPAWDLLVELSERIEGKSTRQLELELDVSPTLLVRWLALLVCNGHVEARKDRSTYRLTERTYHIMNKISSLNEIKA